MTCKDIEGKLTVYHEGILPPEEKSLVEGHLASCEGCSSALEALKKTVDVLKNLPEIEPPPWFTQKIMAKVREEAEQKGGLLKKLFYPFHIKIPIEAFAVLFVAVLGLYIYRATGPEMKTYQTPPAVVDEVPSKDGTSNNLEDRAKTISLPKTKADKEEPSPKEPAPRPEKADVQKLILLTLTLSAENVASASRDVEKILGETGTMIIKKDFRDGIQALVVYYPAQKLQWLLGRLQNVGDIKDYRSMTAATEGNIQVTIQIIPK
jgi:hypothetical protein